VSQVDKVKKKVHKLLTDEFGKVIVDAAGKYEFPYESTLMTVEVNEFLDDQTLVEFAALIAIDSKSNSDVLAWCNAKNMALRLGSVYHMQDGKSNLTLLGHSILGDDLDPAELFTSLKLLTVVADGLDDEFIAEFGGKRYEDI
jgi:hypothetical protein